MENTNKVCFEGYDFISNLSKNKEVYLVQNKSNNQLCVQKLLSLYDKSIYDYLKRHPIKNVPRIIDTKFINNELAVLEEYISGRTLTQYLNSNNTNNSNLIYKLLYKLCDVLKYLHNSKPMIIHRDIKPDNIIITSNDELYLIDFNSAKFFEDTNNKDTHILGTVDYAAPEQYLGQSNPRSDIYAIGVLIQDFINNNSNATLIKQLQPIVNRCKEIDFKNRFRNVSELKFALFRAKHSFLLLAFPGYRNGNFLNMIIATIFYISLFYFCFIYTDFNSPFLNIGSFLIILSFVLVFNNYLNIQRIIPLCKSNNKLIKYIGILLISITTFILVATFFIYL